MTARLDALPVWRELPGGLRIASAASPGARLRGLAGLAAIAPDEALHLERCRSVHTAGMRFALDLVWLSGAGAVMRVDRGVAAWRLRTCLGARSVVETRAGRADAFVQAGLGVAGADRPPPPGRADR